MTETALVGLAVFMLAPPPELVVDDVDVEAVVEDELVDDFFDDEHPTTAKGMMMASGMSVFFKVFYLSVSLWGWGTGNAKRERRGATIARCPPTTTRGLGVSMRVTIGSTGYVVPTPR